MMSNNTVSIRQATLEDLDVIMAIFEHARSYMASVGNPNQWVAGYPEQNLIRREIEDKHCYVCQDLSQRVIATFCFIQGDDPNYRLIENGSWLNDLPYAVLHRLASDGSVSGIADICLEWCFRHTSNLRVDTHQDNKILQHILKKHGFSYCGIIYVANGTPRLAYQKLVE